MEPDHREQRLCHRPKAFDKMETLVKEMQDTESGGVPVRSQKIFLTSIPAAFMGYDLIEWLIMRLEIEESEALNIANQLCQYGYFFPISDSKNLVVKDDSSLYRFQNHFYWPWRNKPPDNVDYAIYLTKRSLRNKQRHGLEEYEFEAFTNLKRNLSNKWDIIVAQAEEQVKQQKSMKKPDKLISDSQEKAYWRVHRPPPGITSSLEQVPVPTRCWNGIKPKKKTIEDCRREVELLRTSLYRTRIKVSQALEGLLQHVDTYTEYDPLLVPPQPSNPWVNEDITYWQLNAPLVEVPTEKRVKKWSLSMEDLLCDPTGVQEFTNYLQKEKSEENILFWLAVNDLRRSSQSQVLWKIKDIYENYVKHGSPREVNIDNQTMDKVLEGMKNNSRFCFDAAQEHVYNLLLKKDCYPRFIRSEYYKNLLSNGIQPLQKKRFFGFGPTKKKSSTSSQPNQSSSQVGSVAIPACGGALSKRRGSDRSLSGSAHEISHFGVGSGTHTTVIKEPKVSHSHSQSNLSDIPYRVKKPSIIPAASTSEEVCPWETPPSPPRTPTRNRKNSTHMDSESSSSDISERVAETSEKVQRSLLTQQHTLDCGKKLHTLDTYETPRRASVSVPITHSTSGIEGARRKVSSFEDNSSSSSTGVSAIFVIPSDKDNKSNDGTGKVLQKSHSMSKTGSMHSGTPIISVSSATDDVISEGDGPFDPPEISLEEVADEEKDNSSTDTAKFEPVAGPSHSEPVPTVTISIEHKAPLAEPDSESPASELPPSEITLTEGENAGAAAAEGEQASKVKEGEEDEGRNTDVCPWEDEESCRVNTPFVKKYATLGYL
ncbi:regulator of G-protein signaling 11 isoform X2 [Anthonomus grandis grandis]|uniref:regulator of G-protein signaling 11 isoform X2 n=1 Tax=Anthonomus grandis grandis TaxID=2921223 RepID=UPI0021660733|nr:regulator of G-protein signaling 11 isoform X2 [Anthonomus grandis grandis]